MANASSITDRPRSTLGKRSRSKDGPKPKHQTMQAEGPIRHVLHGPKGEARGASLEDGTIIRFPPHEVERIAHLLSPGRRLAVRGEGLTSEFGTVIEAREAGPSADKLQPLKPKKLKHEEPRDQPAESHAV